MASSNQNQNQNQNQHREPLSQTTCTTIIISHKLVVQILIIILKKEVSQLKDVGTQLTKLMYNPNKSKFDGTSIIVILPESSFDSLSLQTCTQSSHSRLSRDESIIKILNFRTCYPTPKQYKTYCQTCIKAWNKYKNTIQFE